MSSRRASLLAMRPDERGRHPSIARRRAPCGACTPQEACDSILTPTEVRARFDWALKQGNPGWLWPTVSVADWSLGLETIAQAASEVLRGFAAPRLAAGNEEALDVAAYTSGMGPLLGYWIERRRLSASAPIAGRLALHLEHNRRRMEKVTVHAAKVVSAFSGRGIRSTILKGMHTAFEYFPESATRPLSDIDVLVDANDQELAFEVLARLNLQPVAFCPVPLQWAWRPIGERREPLNLRFVHADDPWAIDLQMSLDRRASAGSPTVRLDALTEIPRTPWPIDPRAATLGQPLLLIQLACHACSGLFNLTLQRQVELVLVIRRDLQNGALNWQEFIEAADRAGASGSVFPSLHMVESLVPGTIPSRILERCREKAPRAVRKVVARLSPATAPQVTRCSIQERYMWVPLGGGLVRQFVDDLLPRKVPNLPMLLRIYRQRIWRVAHGTMRWQ